MVELSKTVHADHKADYVTLMGSYATLGRIDPVDVWGGCPLRVRGDGTDKEGSRTTLTGR